MARSPSPEADLVKQMKTAGKLLGSNFEFSQPIRMRFNHLLAGVFSDVAVKSSGRHEYLAAQRGRRSGAVRNTGSLACKG